MKCKITYEPVVCAVLLSLFVPMKRIHAQCCGGSGAAGNDRRMPLSVQKAMPSIRVQYTGSTAPAALKFGDYVIQLAPNSNRSYALPYTPTTKPPLPGERPAIQLLNAGGGGGQPYTGSGRAKIGPENQKACPLRDGVTGDGAHDGSNQVLDAQKPSSFQEVPAEPEADAAEHERPILNPSIESIVGNIGYGVQRPEPTCTLGYGGFGVKGGELGGTPAAAVDQSLLLDVTFSLGMGIDGDLAAAYLVPALVHEETGNPINFDPLKLEHYRVRSMTSNVIVHTAEENSNNVWIQRDISVPEGYVRQALDSTLTTMSVSFYGADQVVGGNPPTLVEGAEPRMKISISASSDPNPDSNKYNSGWSIVKQVLGQTVVTRSFWTTAQVIPPGTAAPNQYWLAKDTFPDSGESEVQEWASIRTAGQPERVVTMKVRQLSGVTITAQSEKQTHYRLFDWGEEIVKTAEDPAGINLWTEKTYWTGVLQSDPNFGKVKLVAHRDGSWDAYYFERTGMAPDTDLIEHHFSPWLGGSSTAPPAPGADIAALNALKPNCRYRKTTHKANYSTKIEVYVKNTLVRQSEPGAGQANTRDETWDYANGTTKFLTVTKKLGSGPFAHFPSHTYRLKQGQTNEADPNNVISHVSHSYRSAWKTEEAPYYYVRDNYSPADPYDVVELATDPEREPYLMTRTITDRVTGREVARESWVVEAGGAATLLDRQFHQYDLLCRKISTKYMDGRQESWEYAPGSSSITHTDTRGVLTTTELDNFGRLKRIAIHGRNATNYSGPLPAGAGLSIPAQPWVVTDWAYAWRGASLMGQVATATTQARDGSINGAVVTQPGGAPWQRTASITTDGAGREISRTNELGQIESTVYLYSPDGGNVVLTTIGGTYMKIKSRFRDGQLRAITGLGQVPVYYTYSIFAPFYLYEDTAPYAPTGTAPNLSFSATTGYRRTYSDGLGRPVSISEPRSVNASGALLASQSDSFSYDVDGSLRSRSEPTFSGAGAFYHVQSREWLTGGAEGWRRQIKTATSTNTTIDANDTNQRTVEYWLEFSDGLWWKVEAGYSGSGTDPGTNLAEVTRSVLGPMNLSGGYARVKRTSFGSTEEVMLSWDQTAGMDSVRKTLNGVLVYGADSFNGLAFVHSVLNASPAKLAAYSPLREPLHEVSASTIHWPVLVRTPGTGLISQRTAPGVNETYSYYTGSGDYRTGWLYARQPLAAGAGPSRYDYNARGQTTKEWGSGTYPVIYEYDDLGRMTRMHTFRSASGLSTDPDTNPAAWNVNVPADIATNPHWDTTTWAWPAYLDRLLYKESESAPDITERKVKYAYHPNGLLSKRTWQRGIETNYTYNTLNQLTGTTYSDSTPSVGSIAYNAAGWMSSWADAGGTWTRTHRADGFQLSETSSTGRSASWSLDAQGRRFVLNSQAHAQAVSPGVSYTYDEYGRFKAATTSVGVNYYAVNVTYQPGTLLSSLRTSQVNSSTLLYESQSHSTVGQLNSKGYYNAGLSTLQYFAPIWDNGRVSSVTREGSQEWRYGYDSRQQITQGYRKFTNGAGEVLAGTQSEYTYDKIGNRILWKEGGGSTLGAGLRTNTYGAGAAGSSADSLNRYPNASRPQFYDVTGQRATGTTNITVNGAPPTYQQGANGLYFRKEQAANTTGRYTTTTVSVNGIVSDVWNQFTALPTEEFTYDQDGNMLTDGRWTYTWDAENRLTSMTSSPQANPPLAINGVRLEFVYDGLSRRIEKKVYQNTFDVQAWVLNNWELYAYEGWNMVVAARRNNNGSTVKRIGTYVWGPDIASRPFGTSSWQVAGGVGGLLKSLDGTNAAITYTGLPAPPADPTDDHFFVCQDHIGNITGLFKATTGQLVLDSVIDYDPFGRELRSSGRGADLVPFHFSSKFTDSESGFVYYGYRYYDPRNGRWLGRDPLGELGGQNLFNFCRNNSIRYVDDRGGVAFIPFLVKASINAAAEGLTQLAMSALGGKSVPDAIKDIDWGEVGSEGLKGLVPWKIPGGKFGKCAVTAAGNVATQAVMNPATYSPEQAIIDFVTGLIECLSDKCAKKNDAATEKAIAELKDQLEEFKKKLGVDGAAKSATSRVKPRKGTLAEVDKRQPVDADGDMTDPHTGQKLKPGEVDLGHKPGQEWRKRKAMHEEKGSTRKEVLDAENDPDLYQWEDRSSNRSHRHEQD